MKNRKSYIAEGDAIELDEGFFRQAKRGRPRLADDARKQRLNIMLDPDVADRLRADGDISKRVNAIMRRELGLPA